MNEVTPNTPPEPNGRPGFPDVAPPTEEELLEERKALVPGTISDFLAAFEREHPESAGQ
jgi:hypothetical protein